MRAYDLPVPGIPHLYTYLPKTPRTDPGKMTVTTASGLLPAGTAVYVQREPNGVHLETRYSVGLEGFTSQSETRQSNSLLPAWEAGSSEGLQPKQSTCGLSR